MSEKAQNHSTSQVKSSALEGCNLGVGFKDIIAVEQVQIQFTKRGERCFCGHKRERNEKEVRKKDYIFNRLAYKIKGTNRLQQCYVYLAVRPSFKNFLEDPLLAFKIIIIIIIIILGKT